MAHTPAFGYPAKIERVRLGLAQERRLSELANELHAQGLSDLCVLFVLRESTQAPLSLLKGLAQWWGPAGVTDAEAFDAWAAKALTSSVR